MVTTIETPRTQLRPRPVRPRRGTAGDLLRLTTLRWIEDSGPKAGAEVIGAVSDLVCSFGVDPPGYVVLHDLCDSGFLAATDGLPPRYAITAAGRPEAERLSVRCWPSIRDGLAALDVGLGCLAPRVRAPA